MADRSGRIYRAALAGMVAALVVAAFASLGLLLWDALVLAPQRDRAAELQRQQQLAVARDARHTAERVQQLVADRDARLSAAIETLVARLTQQPPPPDPALRRAVLDLCDALARPCTQLRRPG